MENPADLQVIRGMSWNRTGIFLIFSSQVRKAETDLFAASERDVRGNLAVGLGSWRGQLFIAWAAVRDNFF